MTRKVPLEAPPHFQPDKVGQIWKLPYEQRAKEAREWAEINNLTPSRDDRKRICLLLISCQNTFCLPEFELFAAGRSGMGAVEDNIRLCRFIYENLPNITEIYPTMDTHSTIHIFHAAFWIDADGKHPDPLTVITQEDIEDRIWKVNPAIAPEAGQAGGYDRLQKYALHYVRHLRRQGSSELTIWPYHAILGGIGHALVSSVEEAIFFHSIARNSQIAITITGYNVLTEHYSALSPEILEDQDGRPVAQKNLGLIEDLLDFDAIIIAGQAKSHSVTFTIDDLLDEIAMKDPNMAKKVYLLEDCASPVVVPGVMDFTDMADKAYQRFASAGMRLVKSTQPMDQWPGATSIF
jgi:nicotinamidase-related amidase